MISSDVEKGDESNRSFAVFRHTIKNAGSLERDLFYYSNTFKVQQTSWAIAYKVSRPQEHNEDVFGLFIVFKDNANALCPMINMEVELTLVNQSCQQQNISKDFSAFFNTSERTHLGFKKFKFWHDILTRRNGFIQNDEIVVEVVLAATPPQPKVEILVTPETLKIMKKLDQTTDRTASQKCEESLLSRELSNCSLQDRGQYLLNSELSCDCEFLVGKDDNQKTFRANSLMLARASPVFESMFFGDLTQSSPVLVPDVHPNAFYKMLQFAYGCNLVMGTQEEVMDLYYVADKYLVADLQIACVRHVWPTDENDVWPALHMATFYSLPSLLSAALQVVCHKVDAVLQHPEFCGLSANSLLTLVQAHELKVGSELQLFRAVLRWAFASCQRKGLPAEAPTLRNELKDVLPYIRFLSMSQQQFAEEPVFSGLLSTEEQLRCLLAIVQPSLHTPPPTLCSLRSARR